MTSIKANPRPVCHPQPPLGPYATPYCSSRFLMAIAEGCVAFSPDKKLQPGQVPALVWGRSCLQAAGRGGAEARLPGSQPYASAPRLLAPSIEHRAPGRGQPSRPSSWGSPGLRALERRPRSAPLREASGTSCCRSLCCEASWCRAGLLLRHSWTRFSPMSCAGTAGRALTPSIGRHAGRGVSGTEAEGEPRVRGTPGRDGGRVLIMGWWVGAGGCRVVPASSPPCPCGH